MTTITTSSNITETAHNPVATLDGQGDTDALQESGVQA